MSLVKGRPSVPNGTPLSMLIEYTEPYQAGISGRGLATKTYRATWSWTTNRWEDLDAPGQELDIPYPPATVTGEGLAGPVTATVLAGAANTTRARTSRYTLNPVETAPGEINITRSPRPVPIVLPPDQATLLANLQALQQQQQAAIASAQQAAAGAAGSAALVAAQGNAARRVAAGTAGHANVLRGFKDGRAALPELLGAGSAAFLPAPADSPLDPLLVSKILHVSVGTPLAGGLVVVGWPISGDQLPWASGRTHQWGRWMDLAAFAVHGGAGMDAQVLVYNAANALVADLVSAPLAHAQLSQVGAATAEQNGLSLLVADVAGSYAHFQVRLCPQQAGARIVLRFRARGVVKNANDIPFAFLHPVVLADARVPVDPYTVYPDVGESTAAVGGGLLPRRTGGSPGINVLDGDAFRLAAGTDWAAYAVAAHIDALDRAIDLQRGGTADVTGQVRGNGQPAFVPPNSYFKRPNAGGGLDSFSVMPADGLPADALPEAGQVTVVTGPCRVEGGRTLLEYYPGAVIAGPPPPTFQNRVWDLRALPYNVDLTAAQMRVVWRAPNNDNGGPTRIRTQADTGTFAGYPASGLVDASGRDIALTSKRFDAGHYAVTAPDQTPYADGEVLVSLLVHSFSTTGQSYDNDNFQPSALIRASGASGAENGYMARYRSASSGSYNYLQLVRVVGGVSTQIAQSALLPGGDLNGWLCIRLRADGNRLLSKVWLRDTPEPAAWQIDHADTDPAAILGAGYAAPRVNFGYVAFGNMAWVEGLVGSASLPAA